LSSLDFNFLPTFFRTNLPALDTTKYQHFSNGTKRKMDARRVEATVRYASLASSSLLSIQSKQLAGWLRVNRPLSPSPAKQSAD